MIVRLGMAPRRDALDFQEFQMHWRTSHADAVSHLPGLRRYQQFHAVLQDGLPVMPYPGFDACSALQFDTLEAMDAAFASEEFLDAVVADEAAFVDKTRFQGVVGAWRPDTDAVLGSTGPVQLLTLLVAPPGVSPTLLADRLVGSADAATSGTIVANPGAHEGRFPLSADVVRVVGYADLPSARAGAEAMRRVAAPAHIIGEHLAHVVDVPIGAPIGESADGGMQA